jgi:hypothetical protein
VQFFLACLVRCFVFKFSYRSVVKEFFNLSDTMMCSTPLDSLMVSGIVLEDEISDSLAEFKPICSTPQNSRQWLSLILTNFKLLIYEDYPKKVHR